MSYKKYLLFLFLFVVQISYCQKDKKFLIGVQLGYGSFLTQFKEDNSKNFLTRPTITGSLSYNYKKNRSVEIRYNWQERFFVYIDEIIKGGLKSEFNKSLNINHLWEYEIINKISSKTGLGFSVYKEEKYRHTSTLSDEIPTRYYTQDWKGNFFTIDLIHSLEFQITKRINVRLTGFYGQGFRKIQTYEILNSSTNVTSHGFSRGSNLHFCAGLGYKF